MSTTVHYDIDTRVTEDGAVLRSTRFNKNDKLIRKYYDGDEIPSDFIRTSEKTNETSHNTIRVGVTDYFLYKHFTYNETFEDITNKDKFIGSAMKIYDLWVSALAHRIHEAIGEKYRRSEIKDAIIYVYDPLVEELVAAFRKNGLDGAENSEAGKLIDNEDWLIEHIAIRLRPIPYKSYKDFKNSIRSAIDVAENDLEIYINIFLTEKDILNIVGIQGDLFCLFCDDYSFNLSLRLPGKLVEHNGTLLDDGRLLWEFKEEDFIYVPYIMIAESQLFYPVRFFVIGVACVLLLTVIIFIKKLRRVISNH
ncbi:MAG: hypothetical protein GTO02_14430 [Candidatus Dadabacteria bacterium]|nr:hypothetical protein [Candidatus Dadabacteria bacterium]NIQ15542.1 hypothetical protein [Candidatus Dadabacteria bacterium]